jgi:hypothetical protein
MPMLKVSIFFMDHSHKWNWMAGRCRENEGPDYEGGGCDTPEKALREALDAIGQNSVRMEPQGEA